MQGLSRYLGKDVVLVLILLVGATYITLAQDPWQQQADVAITSLDAPPARQQASALAAPGAPPPPPPPPAAAAPGAAPSSPPLPRGPPPQQPTAPEAAPPGLPPPRPARQGGSAVLPVLQAPPPVAPPPPAAPVAAAAALPDPSYSAALSLAIKYLEVQQSGTLPSWNRVRRAAGGWRDNAHTWEGASISKDLSGGYYDGAHSYRMTLPTAFLVNNLAAALQMFGPVRGAGPVCASVLRG
jgi:hypothetical protein